MLEVETQLTIQKASGNGQEVDFASSVGDRVAARQPFSYPNKSAKPISGICCGACVYLAGASAGAGELEHFCANFLFEGGKAALLCCGRPPC